MQEQRRLTDTAAIPHDRAHAAWRTWLVVGLGLLALLLTTSMVTATPAAVIWPELRLTQVATGFVFPVHLAAPNDGSGRIFVVEKAGRIHILQDGTRLPDPFLDISERVRSTCNECGLLSVAFPPDFTDDGYFFVYYSAIADLFPELERTGSTQDSMVARFRVSADPNRADPASEETILTQFQPAANHNGGQIAFAPDGTLFIGFGDGGGGGDPFRTAQDTSTWLGKLLRIEVGASGTYTVPADNPFVGEDGVRPEIWATGLRNPWRFSFEPDGTLYIGDVGQNSYEEINVAFPDEAGNPVGGINYGWSIMEGEVCYPALDANCNMEGLTLPVATYATGLNCAVTGGMVFASPYPGQAPVYLYGDYCSGRIWGLQPPPPLPRVPFQWQNTELLESGLRITSFGRDADGTVYVVDGNGGIYRVEEIRSLPFRQWLPVLSTGP